MSSLDPARPVPTLPKLSGALLLVTAVASCAPAPVSPPSDDGGEAMLAYLDRTAGIAWDKFVALAEAMPEDTYDWRPMEGVRSVGEVFAHVAADNWYGPALMGVPAPESTGVTADGSSVGPYQERERTKEEIVREVEVSFEHLLAAIDSTADRLDEETLLGSNTVTYGDVWVRLLVHMHEHLGQSVAYARTNGVVPPWSR